MGNSTCDIVVVGGGIIGLATTLALRQRYPDARIVVLEKESVIADHQTGHNSGVIHAGIYYKPGSYKAKLCVGGVRLMKNFCEEEGIPYENCGKLIVATDESEVGALEALRQRGTANGVPGLRTLSAEEVREVEPKARAVSALLSPETAIVDYRRVAAAMADRLTQVGVDIQLANPLRSIEQSDGEMILGTAKGDIRTRHLINCAGLYADRVARMAGVSPSVRIVPFRGEYYTLPRDTSLIRALIYPVPDPRFPFLGVHFTKRIDGAYEAGPNAVLAFAREGYKMRTVSVAELGGTLAYRGFWAMGARYWRMGVDEFYRSLSKKAFTRALQKLVPDIRETDLLPGGSGVRAQAVRPNGDLVDDFEIQEHGRSIHVLNAPSPGATASLAIGNHIAELAASRWEM